MIWIRSAVFNFLFFAWTGVVVLVAVPLLALPERVMIAYARGWAWSLLFLLKVICGLDYRVVGREKVPEGGAIVACKHQSAWETIVYFAVFDAPVYILKRELLMVPFFGWCLIKSGMIPIDRKGGAVAMRKVITRATAAPRTRLDHERREEPPLLIRHQTTNQSRSPQRAASNQRSDDFGIYFVNRT